MSMKTVIMASAFVGIPMVAGVQTQSPVDVPRTAWGHPHRVYSYIGKKAGDTPGACL